MNGRGESKPQTDRGFTMKHAGSKMSPKTAMRSPKMGGMGRRGMSEEAGEPRRSKRAEAAEERTEKQPGSRNFGKPDHHGTTNVRSKHINSLPGTGGSRHIDTAMNVGGAGAGRHINAAIAPPMPQAPGGVPGVQDADEPPMPSILSAVPMHQSEGGFG